MRLLLLATALVSLLLGHWNTSTERAIADVGATCNGWVPTIVAPYVLVVEQSDNVSVTKTYYLWCFGRVQKLPFSRKTPDTRGIILTVRPHIVVQPEPEIARIPFSSQR